MAIVAEYRLRVFDNDRVVIDDQYLFRYFEPLIFFAVCMATIENRRRHLRFPRSPSPRGNAVRTLPRPVTVPRDFRPWLAAAPLMGVLYEREPRIIKDGCLSLSKTRFILLGRNGRIGRIPGCLARSPKARHPLGRPRNPMGSISCRLPDFFRADAGRYQQGFSASAFLKFPVSVVGIPPFFRYILSSSPIESDTRFS